MDGQNFNNGQNTGTPQYSNYQNNTVYQQPPVTPGNSGKASGTQIASLVLGIISILLCCCYGAPSLILGIIGLVCGIKGNKENKNGVGTAGIVCSIIGLIMGVASLIYYIIVGAALFSVSNDPSYWY